MPPSQLWNPSQPLDSRPDSMFPTLWGRSTSKHASQTHLNLTEFPARERFWCYHGGEAAVILPDDEENDSSIEDEEYDTEVGCEIREDDGSFISFPDFGVASDSSTVLDAEIGNGGEESCSSEEQLNDVNLTEQASSILNKENKNDEVEELNLDEADDYNPIHRYRLWVILQEAGHFDTAWNLELRFFHDWSECNSALEFPQAACGNNESSSESLHSNSNAGHEEYEAHSSEYATRILFSSFAQPRRCDGLVRHRVKRYSPLRQELKVGDFELEEDEFF